MSCGCDHSWLHHGAGGQRVGVKRRGRIPGYTCTEYLRPAWKALPPKAGRRIFHFDRMQSSSVISEAASLQQLGKLTHVVKIYAKTENILSSYEKIKIKNRALWERCWLNEVTTNTRRDTFPGFWRASLRRGLTHHPFKWTQVRPLFHHWNQVTTGSFKLS